MARKANLKGKNVQPTSDKKLSVILRTGEVRREFSKDEERLLRKAAHEVFLTFVARRRASKAKAQAEAAREKVLAALHQLGILGIVNRREKTPTVAEIGQRAQYRVSEVAEFIDYLGNHTSDVDAELSFPLRGRIKPEQVRSVVDYVSEVMGKEIGTRVHAPHTRSKLDRLVTERELDPPGDRFYVDTGEGGIELSVDELAVERPS